MRYEFLAPIAAILQLVVCDACSAPDVGVDGLAGVSVDGKELEGFAGEGADEERHSCDADGRVRRGKTSVLRGRADVLL